MTDTKMIVALTVIIFQLLNKISSLVVYFSYYISTLTKMQPELRFSKKKCLYRPAGKLRHFGLLLIKKHHVVCGSIC